jgi:very-short-patch-repair endonuclease
VSDDIEIIRLPIKEPYKLAGILSKKKTNKEFIEQSEKIYKYKYDYSLSEYTTSKIKVKIICKKHGVFEQRPNDHFNGCGCPICKSSKGELIITEYLSKNDILFETQKSFIDCKDKGLLKFDFYLPKHNLCIEYDGKQHFISNDFFGGEKRLIEQQKKDEIKNIYCKENNIKLIRIKYDQKIINFLLKQINKL